MNRKRGNFSLPAELQTTERITTKTEMAMRGLAPRCPSVPVKIRKSFLPIKKDTLKPKPISFLNNTTLSPLYNSKYNVPYIDQVFGKCGFLGEGSFGKVFRVVSRDDHKMYAVKRLKSTISVKDRCAEVKNNEKIGIHPNCVQFFMAWEENNETFLLLEYCDMSLEDYARKNNDISELMLWDVLYDMCKGLNFLHKQNYVHLDVKPGNIMMRNGFYKLGDFGLLVDLSSDGKHVFKSTLSDGDSKYLALEVLEGVYTPACDVFGLGISLLELAADLELPDHGPLWQQLRHDVIPKRFYDRVSLGFKIVVERMISPEYTRRPAAEKILKYPNLRGIEKRDFKQPRVNYATQYVTVNFGVLPLSPVNLNNNLVNTTDDDDEEMSDEDESGQEARRGLSRKSLFSVKDDSWRMHKSSSTGSECSDDHFDTLSFHDSTSNSMDLDESHSVNNNLQLNENSVFGTSAVTSTPVVKSKNSRKAPKVKLTF